MRLGFLLATGIFATLLASSAPSQPARGLPEVEGLIEPYRLVNLGVPAEGRLETIGVDRGDHVEEGQLLATLDSTVEDAALQLAREKANRRSALESASVRIEFNRRKLEQMETLYGKGILSDEEIDEVRTNETLAELSLLKAQEEIRLAELEAQRASARLKLRKITSPVRGVVVERFLSPGELVASNMSVLTVAQIDPLHVEIFVPVELLGSFELGMEAEVIPEGPDESPHVARIKVIDRVVDAASGTFGIRLEMQNPTYDIPAGLRCKVRIKP